MIVQVGLSATPSHLIQTPGRSGSKTRSVLKPSEKNSAHCFQGMEACPEAASGKYKIHFK